MALGLKCLWAMSVFLRTLCALLGLAIAAMGCTKGSTPELMLLTLTPDNA